MAQPQKVGLFRAIFRYFRYWSWRKARYIHDAAEAQFTGSPEGIAAAFDIHQQGLVDTFNELRGAVAEVEGVQESKRVRLERLNEREAELIQLREGAVAQAEQAQEAGNEEALAAHSAAFERFDSEIQDIEGQQARLERELDDVADALRRHMLQLEELSAEIQGLPAEKAGAIADFVSASKIMELNDRLTGIQGSFDRGPIEAVLTANRRLTAEARISQKLAGTDAKLRELDYAAAGRESAAKQRMQEMLAARRAERAGRLGDTTAVETEERPKI